MVDTISKLLKFNVHNRFTGAVQFTAEIDCAPDASTGFKRGLAVKWAVKNGCNDFRGHLLSGAYLDGADFIGIDFSGANLADASFRRSNLAFIRFKGAVFNRSTNFSGANFTHVYFGDQWIIQGATRSDDYPFFLQKLTADSEPMVKAGCHYFTLRKAQEHWEKTRAGTALFAETRAIIRCMVDLAHARGLMKDGKLAPKRHIT